MSSRPECVGMARRLSSDVARNTRRRVRAAGICCTLSFIPLSGPMTAHSSMQSRQTLSINILVVLTIIKGTAKTAFGLPILMYIVAISPSFTQQNPNGTETCGVSTRRRWSIASICKHSSTVGDIMPTVPRRHNPKSKFSRR